ncbi:myosin regulatory light chain 9 [Enteropsectra breve]|nr:myosin regulatory light chain 9 [Enteropsectra breve]
MEGYKDKIFERFTSGKGTAEDRMRAIGYPSIIMKAEGALEEPKTSAEFQAQLEKINGIDRESMENKLKKCFKAYLKRGDLRQILKNGNSGFSEEELDEAYRVLPVDEDHGIMLSEFVSFMYQ